MFCPNCGNNIRDDSNYCEKCGIPLQNQRSRTQPALIGTTWNRCKTFIYGYYRENKPGFIIIVVVLLAMLGAIAHFGYSLVRPGKLVVTLEKISREEYLDLFTKATLRVYCKEFPRDCAERNERQVEKDIRLTLPMILRPVKTMDAKITYKNNTRHPILVQRRLYRASTGPWQSENLQSIYSPKLQRLRSEIQLRMGNVQFATKVDLANTIALTEVAPPFNLLPGEHKAWRLGYNDDLETQVEYIQNGKLYRTPVLRVR